MTFYVAFHMNSSESFFDQSPFMRRVEGPLGVDTCPWHPEVSTVRYPISQRTFQYVATVQAVTDETCQ